MTKEEWITSLSSVASDEAFIAFQKRSLCTKKHIIGVRTPDLRRLSKTYRGRYREIRPFSDDTYETCFLKLCLAETLPYEELLAEMPYLLSLMDCWALTDTFKPKSIAKHKREYSSVLKEQLFDEREFYQRFALVTLLSFYREEEDLPLVFESLVKAENERYYYVHMASAWLMAEVLIRHYARGVAFLKEGLLPVRTHNKAIQKARESFRMTEEQKEYLKSLKRY